MFAALLLVSSSLIGQCGTSTAWKDHLEILQYAEGDFGRVFCPSQAGLMGSYGTAANTAGIYFIGFGASRGSWSAKWTGWGSNPADAWGGGQLELALVVGFSATEFATGWTGDANLEVGMIYPGDYDANEGVTGLAYEGDFTMCPFLVFIHARVSSSGTVIRYQRIWMPRPRTGASTEDSDVAVYTAIDGGIMKCLPILGTIMEGATPAVRSVEEMEATTPETNDCRVVIAPQGATVYRSYNTWGHNGAQYISNSPIPDRRHVKVGDMITLTSTVGGTTDFNGDVDFEILVNQFAGWRCGGFTSLGNVPYRMAPGYFLGLLGYLDSSAGVNIREYAVQPHAGRFSEYIAAWYNQVSKTVPPPHEFYGQLALLDDVGQQKIIASISAKDIDGDGFNDAFERVSLSDPYNYFDRPRDRDGDNVPDVLDVDIDGNGIANWLEPDGDSDGDGFTDGAQVDLVGHRWGGTMWEAWEPCESLLLLDGFVSELDKPASVSVHGDVMLENWIPAMERHDFPSPKPDRDTAGMLPDLPVPPDWVGDSPMQEAPAYRPERGQVIDAHWTFYRDETTVLYGNWGPGLGEWQNGQQWGTDGVKNFAGYGGGGGLSYAETVDAVYQGTSAALGDMVDGLVAGDQGPGNLTSFSPDWTGEFPGSTGAGRRGALGNFLGYGGTNGTISPTGFWGQVTGTSGIAAYTMTFPVPWGETSWAFELRTMALPGDAFYDSLNGFRLLMRGLMAVVFFWMFTRSILTTWRQY